MKLHYTPKSHFARKDRILMDALALDIELIDAGNVAASSPELFAHNPMMKVPTLVDGDQLIFESDHIAAYLIRKFDPEDRFNVLTTDSNQLNIRAVLNGVMTAEVELIMAKRTGIDTQKYTRFDKFRATVNQGLEWLEKHAELISDQPTYNGFHLVCLWDHLIMYEMFDLSHKKLKVMVSKLSELDYVKASSPF
ncbi:MAG: glutathione S-transferase family protein [Marinicella sp.]